MTMTDAELAEIRERVEKATPGPWGPRETTPHYLAYVTSHEADICSGMLNADAAFIAAARTDVPLLCDEVDALRGELARARAERDILKPVVQAYASGFRHSRLANDALNMVNDDAAVAAYMRDAGRGDPRP